MLKKSIKKFIATALAVATVATTMVAPVSASTLTPKKSHSKAEITDFVDYYNEITYAYTFRPDRYVPALLSSGVSGTHDSYTYKAWQMTELLKNTPGIDDDQKADMTKAAKEWKKSYVSELMLAKYWNNWERVYYYIEANEGTFSSRDTKSKYEALVKKTYTSVNAYLSSKAKYNQKLAAQLKKFNKTRYTVWNADIGKYFSWSKSKRISYANSHYEPYMGSTLRKKYRMSPIAEFTSGASLHVDDFGDSEHYKTKTLGIWGYSNDGSPCDRLHKHTRYNKW